MKRALVVGINEFIYHPEANLRGCRNDAMRMQAFLQVELEVPETEIIWLLDRKAEAARITDTLQSLVELTQEGDFLAFTYSSHGTQIVDVDGDELDGYHEALCATDIKSDGNDWVQGVITDKTLREIIKKVRPDARVEIWLDTCFAGGVKNLSALGLTYSRARMLRHPQAKSLPKKRLLGLAPPDNAVIWAACKEAQTSADSFIEGEWRGAFTHFFLANYAPDAPRSVVLKRTRAGLMAHDYSQVPQCTFGESGLSQVGVGE